MKLNKTQQMIMDEIAKRGYYAFTHGYRTHCKNGSWGHRVSNAAIKLRDAGLVVFKSINRYQDCTRYYTDHWSEIVVTAPGKAA